MTKLDHNAREMRDLVCEFHNQVRFVDATSAGPKSHYALNVQELRVIELIGHSGPKMMRELADHLLLAVNSVTSVVDHLEKRGFVARVRSEEDRRVVRVELTDTGREAFDSDTEEILNFTRCLLASLTDSEQEIFLVLLRKVAAAGRHAVDQRRTAGTA